MTNQRRGEAVRAVLARERPEDGIDGEEIYRTTIGGEEDQRAIDQNGVSAVEVRAL